MGRRYYMQGDRLMVVETDEMLVKCQIPGCDVIVPESELFVHEVGHPDPVEPQPEPVRPLLATHVDGVYTVTSLNDEF